MHTYKDALLSIFWAFMILASIGLLGYGVTGSKSIGAIVAGSLGVIVVIKSYRTAVNKKLSSHG